ncbi:uncharacterized protein LOC130764285 [Actinidia eriantha]|uniref:uncharacterized protein LOC130764285 n=1 Tax=Actinidia eriantha TaxID=165200 RepID=UPI00258FCFE6|nr:uncharacterized protein LOC130764285 [Actinidia eriantha]
MSETEANPIASHVASLWNSLRQVPPAAVPAMLDCIISSVGLSSSSLFNSLIDAFPNLTKDIIQGNENNYLEQPNYARSFVAAACHLLKKSGANFDAMQSFIWKILVPLMKLLHAHDCEILDETADSFFEVVAETNTWGIVEATMVPFFLRLVGLSTGLLQSEELAIYEWSSSSVFQGIDDHLTDADMNKVSMMSQSESFPLHISCHILTLIFNSVTQSQYTGGKASDSSLTIGSYAETIAENLLWDLCNMTVRMLCQSIEHRSCAIKIFLPNIFKAFVTHRAFKISVRGQTRMLSRMHLFKKIWACCKTLFSLGLSERRDSYSVLSLYFTTLSCTDGGEDDDTGDREEGFDIRTEKEFWDEIKKGLVDKDGLVRKQSIHILKTTLQLNEASQCYSGVSEMTSSSKSSLPNGLTKKGRWADMEAKSLGIGNICDSLDPSLNSQQKWVSFFLLYEMLEEYGTHLVEAAWNHQITLLLRSSFPLDGSMKSVSGVLNQNLMEAPTDIFNWLSVLWERGLLHGNPHVRCLIMESFLGIEWKNYRYCDKLVTEDFVLGPFIQGLNDPVHHKDFGNKGIYYSRTIEGATKFMCQYASDLNLRKRIVFLTNLASASKKQSFGRAGLMGLAECISSAAFRVPIHCENGVEWSKDASFNMVQVQSASGISFHNDKTDLLDVLRFVVESSKQHFNPKYRLRVCEKVMDAVASVTHAFDVSLEILLHFISAVPREFTDSGGSLRVKIQEWLLACNDEHCTPNCCCTEVHLLKSLCDFPRRFMGLPHSVGVSFNYDDEDLDAWGLEAKRWARVVFLVTKEANNIDPILMFIRTYGVDICKQNKHREWVPLKFLFLVLSLIEELQIMQERVTDTGNEGRTKVEHGSLEIKEHSRSTEIFIIIDQFAKLFLAILEGLVSFASSSCSIFWGDKVEDANLPSSIRGKLGGPSQRRLSSSATTAVLEAIMSVKVVTYVSLWCVQFENAGSLYSAFIFLWKFFSKIASLSVFDSETAAEIWLAAYEALAHGLKAIVLAFPSLALDLIMENHKPSSGNAEGKPLLDSLVLSFLQNINNLIAGEKLVRSRRAILMNWKWICLEYLLSFPYHAFEIGVRMDNGNCFFSDATLRWLFGDLVDSLENAGEASVLPMLRSIRLVLELFDSGSRTHSAVSSSNGTDVQMMWHLVRSSWILHVSCNKRRVAPIAALLSSVLHYSVFNKECMHETDSAPGPLKWFIEKILEEGTKSPRTTRLAALHLTGLWLLNPKTIKYYMKELKLLTLYGSVQFDEDFEAELAENFDARREVSLLAKSSDFELSEAFINTELYARVSVAALIYKLADLAAMVRSENEVENCQAALESGKMFLLELLDLAVNDKDLAKELYKKYSGVHRRKIRVWQMICILSRFVDQHILPEVTCSLHISLCRNNLPAVRQYLETFAINIYLSFPSLVREQLVPIFRDYDMRPQALSSYVFIAANVILHAPATVQSNYLVELLPPIIPLLTSHHHSLRGFTQLLVYQVLRKLLPPLDSSAFETMPLEKRCFEDLKIYLAKNSDCARLRASMEGYLDAFDPKDSITPSGIFSNRVEDLEFECVPTSLMEQVTTFLNDVREDLRCTMSKDAETIKNESLRINEDLKSLEISRNVGKEKLQALLPKDMQLDFQKKITISKDDRQETDSGVLLGKDNTYNTLAEMEREDQLLDELLHSKSIEMEKMRGNRQHLILVASLIDRIPNLAGLARTCEVFRAAGLVVADANIVHDKQFQLISVTAEKWVPIMEVPVSNLKVFLHKKKREGFSILGLEQTANSIRLDQYVFPKKTVLVLGREKEGIPVEIIHILDACIEIPQLGVVRSLNVHVSGAIALWEYTRQQRSL